MKQNSTEINQADTAWVLVSTALVFIMVPGLGHFYGGMTRTKHQLSVMLCTIFSASIICIEWFICGFSLAFSPSGSPFIGNFEHVVLRNVGNAPSALAPNIPYNTFMLFQCMFAVITPSLAFGCISERATLRGFFAFTIIWSVSVYDVVAYWIWSTNGWLKTYGTLDFAGGIVVHVVAGFSAFAYSLVIGPRRGFNKHTFHVVNIQEVFVGTGLLWFGWAGFNGGSNYAINSRTVNAVITSYLAAASGAVSWLITEMLLTKNFKTSLFGFCNGAIAGLACVTPAAGYVSPASSLVFGLLSGPICVFGSKIKEIKKLKFDDPCDVFGVHGIAGILGSLLTAVFADDKIVTMAGDPPIRGGLIDGNYSQLLYQFVGICAAAIWSFGMTLIILKILNCIPHLNLRLTNDEEKIGTDVAALGEKSFNTKTEIEESWEKSITINLPSENEIKSPSPSNPRESILNENIETISRGPNLNIQDDEIDLYSGPNIN